MNSNEKRALVPRLRFPEFVKAWKSSRVGEIANIYKGKGIAKSDISEDGIHLCIRYGELYTVYSELITEVVSKTSLPAKDLFFGKANDVIIPSSGETKEDIATAACVIPDGIAFGGDLNVLRSQESGAFLSYYLNGPLKKSIACVAQGDSVVHLYPYQLEKLPIAVPSLAEQQKIADCLSSIDELIGLQTQRLNMLKTHKKGLMQQLFPAEGETVPRLRFPEFRSAGEWESTQLDQLMTTITPPRKIPTIDYQPEGQFPIIDQGQSDIAGWTNDPDSLVEHDQPVIVFGDHTCALKLMRRPFAQGADGIKIIKFNGLAATEFLYQYLCFRPVVPEEYKRHFSILKTKIVAYPKQKNGEQQKIADCLSSIDKWIDAQTKKLDALKTYKKGLMQQLFPELEEIQT